MARIGKPKKENCPRNTRNTRKPKPRKSSHGAEKVLLDSVIEDGKEK